MSRIGSTAYIPRTKIRRRGLATSRSLKMRGIVKKAAVYVVLLFGFCLTYVWTRVQVVETGYRLRALEVDRAQLKETNRSLMVEAATLRSPQRLEALAASMSLKRPTENQIFYLRTAPEVALTENIKTHKIQ